MKSVYYLANEEKGERRWFKNVKLIGELDNGTSVYIEDYAYTYIKQYSITVLSKEISGLLVGEYRKEAKQVIVCGFIPINADLLSKDDKWLNSQILDEAKDEISKYFAESQIVGWMHTQPGYGIMATPQEVSAHQMFFDDEKILMLIDPIAQKEYVYVLEGKSFIKKEGFCVYYEKNEKMQEYMIENPINKIERKENVDELVASFRKMGNRRKEEIERRNKLKKIVGTAGIIGITIFSFISGIYFRDNKYVPEVLEVTTAESEPENDIEDILFDEDFKIAQEPAKVPPYTIHFVEVGDNLVDISYRYFDTSEMASEIAKFNNITNKDSIYIGQELKIPVIWE